MIIESIVGALTTVNIGMVGWLVKRQDNIKKEFMDLRQHDLDFIGNTLGEIKTDVREIYKLLAQDNK